MFPDIRRPRVYMGLLALSLLLIIPFAIQSPFVYHLFVLICVYGALATAWNIVGGYAGQLSLGHAVFYGVGSYAATLLVIHFGISPWLGMFVGMALAALVALLIAYPTFRLRGPFFALATIAVLEVVKLLVVHQDGWTGGAAGLSVPLNIGLPWMIFREKWAYLLVAFLLLLVTLWAAWRIRHSRLGFYLVAVREREYAAPAVGIDTVRVKLAAAVISAMLTAMVGSFHAMYLTFIEPSAAFSLELSIQIAMFALIGGLGSVAGPLAGTVLVVPIAELARGWLGAFGSGMHGFIYGVILVVVVLTMPRGIVGHFGARLRSWIDRLPGLGEPPVAPAAPLAAAGGGRGEPILKAEALNKHFGGLHATNNVSLTLHEGEILGVIGPNGAGKTTVFNQLSGFIRPDSGTVSVRGPKGWEQPADSQAFARAGVGRTFQIAQPFSGLSVLENIMLGAFLHTSDRREAEAIARQVAELTELSGSLDAEARSLTVGGLKRLEVARALATRPRILLLDEVMAGLNPTDVERAIRMVRRVRDAGVSVLLIEHLMQATMALSDRILVINVGQVLTSGAPQEVVNDPQVIEAYLGKEYLHAQHS
ncbi:branched-chain amino acid ABC transporter ATP-binding protein/permease [Bordetella pseudohinzii]|uniref:Branched-chain amino acid ABC transporter ATP-binding protein n=1 Tax=Bordetella pseudohinzii TaxID=1331258 RepID=A0A0J6C1U4_9BORD|nr:branched-chain amino acid ABC transporter ATP-binding protein/permease [Bordetella pseudohinzii]ANY17666.1 branched-chain amino acid ABC transporter ATP-binding protein [Bordetella pseudohinzii]KMM24741.1 branched-chain amino acid ABC transporter ATP-binding protein [Bordetella pseudohinzii]KXA76915.1 branched-chain amino acid ABC transporter ATP-binding protein [Bordetella pseudohinzii]KXA77227.1 branched-chain amino acid ABC transporter ATP-binding protein [Bordetella pseudohinzii]CUJ0117